MTQVQKIYQYEDYSLQSDEQNKFEEVEKIVEDIVKKGIPRNLTLSTFIVQTAKEYGINIKEAKVCINLAMNELGSDKEEKEEENKLYAQSGYYYPAGYKMNNSITKQDGMDSLSCLGSYNRLMFLK